LTEKVAAGKFEVGRKRRFRGTREESFGGKRNLHPTREVRRRRNTPGKQVVHAIRNLVRYLTKGGVGEGRRAQNM